jgi:serine/threonine protein kinase
MKYPRQLSAGSNNTVISLSESEAAKLFTTDTRSNISSEAAKMQYANSINGLVVQFIRLDYNEELQTEMLVMERIYHLDYRAYEVEKREHWLEVFEDKLKVQHSNGFVHRHLNRSSKLEGHCFDNILLTIFGLRLIDVGISALRSQVGDAIFKEYVEAEIEDMNAFRKYFLNR